MTAIAEDPIMAALGFAGTVCGVIAFVQAIVRFRRRARPAGLPRIHLIGHGMRRTMSGR